MNPDGSSPNSDGNTTSGGNTYPGGPPYPGFHPYPGGPPYPGFHPYSGGPYVGGPFNPQVPSNYYQFSFGRGIDPGYGDDVYRPSMVGTPPGSNESNVVPESDPAFSTDEYELSDMEPSPPKEDPILPPKGKGRGRGKGKGKAAEPSEAAPAGRTKRVNYSPQESMALARCWVDVSEDPIVSNMQTQGGFWGRVQARYAVVKPTWAKAHNADQLRKHWERMKADIAKWQGIYENNQRVLGSGHSEDDVKELSLKQFSNNGIFTPFKHWEAWLILKDIPKFQAGLDPNAPKRTRLSVSGSYSSGGGESIDLTSQADESAPTGRRPMGVKAAKRKGKAKASGEEAQSARGSEHNALGEAADAALHRTLLDTLKVYSAEPNEEVKAEYKILIRKMKRKLGISDEGM